MADAKGSKGCQERALRALIKNSRARAVCSSAAHPIPHASHRHFQDAHLTTQVVIHTRGNRTKRRPQRQRAPHTPTLLHRPRARARAPTATAAALMQALRRPCCPGSGPAPPTQKRRRVLAIARASNQNEAPVNAATRRLAELAAEAQRAAQKYARDSGLDKKAADAAKEAQKMAERATEEAAQQARTFSMKLEREHALSRRWERLKKRVDEAIADADANWGVRRKFRSAVDTAQRRWPALKARANEFFATPAGQATAVALLVVLIASGALWSLLSLLWVAWWFLIPVNLYMAEKKKGEMRRQAQEQQAQQASPFGGAWGRPFGGGGNGGSSSSSSDRYSGSGPVIDAEYTVIEEDDKRRRR